MDKYKVVIVDDDEVSLENLSFELRKDARFSLEGTARNGRKGKKLITKVQPDLLFLDVVRRLNYFFFIIGFNLNFNYRFR